MATKPAGESELRLLESILHEPGRGYFLLEAHLSRIAASAAHFGFPFDRSSAGRALVDAAEGCSTAAKVRLLLEPSGTLTAEPRPLLATSEPVRVRIARDPVDSGDLWLRHKTTFRAVYDARLAAHPDFDDVLLVNERGELTESTIANLVVEWDGAMWTPPVDAGLLPGVFRGALLRTGTVRERTLRPADLLRADAVYLVNSVRRLRRALVEPR
jgi:para-aminobenzoate synthetase / 4-amino-4-deoxychorismate lyase